MFKYQRLLSSIKLSNKNMIQKMNSKTFLTNLTTNENVTTPKATFTKSGSSLGQRLLSFLAGLGIGFTITSYFLYEELIESNDKFSTELRDLDRRLKMIENKK